jgi:predicted nucleic acid-binding protein
LIYAFFDSCVYIDWWRGAITDSDLDVYFAKYVIRLSPVVWAELKRGACTADARRLVQDLSDSVLFLPPPTLAMWKEAGAIALTLSSHFSQRFAEKLQNDILIALTARYTGTLLVTKDKHFKVIRKQLDFMAEYL